MKKEVLNNDALTVRVNTEPVLDVIEDSLDMIEDKLDRIEEEAERVVTVVRNNPAILVGVAVLALGAGAAIGYYIGVKRTTLKYEDILRDEIQAAKDFYGALRKDEFPTPGEAVEALHPGEAVHSLKSYREGDRVEYDRISPSDEARVDAEKVQLTSTTLTETPRGAEIVEETVEAKRNVFTRDAPREWDYNAEILERTPEKPYVIHFDEFTANEEGHDQDTLTYFAEDDTLVDKRDRIIDDTEYTVGDDNMLRFGHGSNDPNIVYVRNEKIDMDFEIIRSNGSYSKDVLGIESEPAELRHSRDQRNRRDRRRRERDG